MERLPELLARWQDDALDADEYEEFVRILGEPDARAELAQELLDLNTIREAFAEIRAEKAVDEVRAEEEACAADTVNSADAVAVDAAPVDEGPAGETVDEAKSGRHRKRLRRPFRILRLRGRSSPGTALAVAAGLAAAATVVIAVLLDSPPRREDERDRVAETSHVPVRQPVTPAPPNYEAPAPAPEVRIARLDKAEGAVEIATRGGAWRPATPGAPLASGSRIRTRSSRARVVFESGTVLLMNRFTTLAMARGDAAPLVDMSGGEVFVEIAARDTGFCVATPHGRAVDLGTRFGVGADRDRTVIFVTEGLVTASTDAGSADIGAGEEVALTGLGALPGTVRPARDLGSRLAWTKAFSPARPEPPAPPGPDGPAVVSFTLMNTDTDRPIRGFAPLVDGAVVDLARVGARYISVRADTVPARLGSVRFELDGDPEFNVESIIPYTLSTDTDGDCEPWKTPLGSHVLTAVPYLLSRGRGEAGTPLTIRFRVIDSRKRR